MAIEIPFRNENRDNNPCWISVKDSRPIIKCECGKIFGLNSHNISKEGIVTPSVHHSKEKDSGCGFHAYIKLKDYKGPAYSKLK